MVWDEQPAAGEEDSKVAKPTQDAPKIGFVNRPNTGANGPSQYEMTDDQDQSHGPNKHLFNPVSNQNMSEAASDAAEVVDLRRQVRRLPSDDRMGF